MERQHTHSSRFRSKVGRVLVGLATLVVLGNLGWSAMLTNCFCATAGDSLGIWPCVLLAGCRVMQAYVLHQHGLLGWLLQMLLSLWPLLPGADGAI
jgi:hypothetical protein